MRLFQMLALVGLGLALASPLAAQFRYPFVAFAADFDGDAPVVVDGRIERVHWDNPRARIVVRETGGNRTWDIFTASALELGDKGYRQVLTEGLDVKIRGYRDKLGQCAPSCRAVARDITFR